MSALSNSVKMVAYECPFDDCNLVLTYKNYLNLLCKKDFEKYKRFLVDRIVEQSVKHTWCPNPKCDKIIKLHINKKDLGFINVNCKFC